MPRLLVAVALLVPAALGPLVDRAAASSASVAALQVALRAQGLYRGDLDGLAGPGTVRAVRRLQRRRHLPVDGIAGTRTRAALGRRGRPRVGSRVIRPGARGWDVAVLQFKLGSHGFPFGTIDGGFGPRTGVALRRFQRWARLGADGLAGPGTLRALRRRVPRSPVALRRPLGGPLSSRFGPRGGRFHTGLDFASPRGTTVRAARSGTVTWAGWRAGGWGRLVSVAHGRGLRTVYAHLARVDVRRGRRVAAGTRVGAVGATGTATGPHLHFEVRLRSAALDPLTGLR